MKLLPRFPRWVSAIVLFVIFYFTWDVTIQCYAGGMGSDCCRGMCGSY